MRWHAGSADALPTSTPAPNPLAQAKPTPPLPITDGLMAWYTAASLNQTELSKASTVIEALTDLSGLGNHAVLAAPWTYINVSIGSSGSAWDVNGQPYLQAGCMHACTRRPS